MKATLKNAFFTKDETFYHVVALLVVGVVSLFVTSLYFVYISNDLPISIRHMICTNVETDGEKFITAMGILGILMTIFTVLTVICDKKMVSMVKDLGKKYRWISRNA